jgi:Ring hydroxylating beta subunit
VEILTATPTEMTVRSRFLVYRNRVETETDFFVGRRKDVLRKVDGHWKIARRKILLDQNVLLAKNLTVFFALGSAVTGARGILSRCRRGPGIGMAVMAAAGPGGRWERPPDTGRARRVARFRSLG